MTVELMTKISPELVDAMTRLIPQLSRSAPVLSAEQIEAFISQPSVHLFVYRDPQTNTIQGMLSLATFVIPTGLRAWIEDVVVDEAARGQGAGEALVHAATDHAQNLGSRTVDLTSRPSREAANRLYKRCNFTLRETNVYRFTQSDIGNINNNSPSPRLPK